MNPIISCSHISFAYGENEILKDVSFSIQRGEIFAVVGPNGVGKSTLLRIIAGQIEAKNGAITLGKDVKISYMSQEISKDEIDQDVPYYLKGDLTDDFRKLNLPADIRNKKLSELSGGERSKVNLLRLIQEPSDLYILDEPTNNLDVSALEFLEAFIRKNKNKSAFLIVSHDRQLLENFADKIIEIDSNTLGSNIYPGPFSEYMILRKQKIENEWKKYEDYLTDKRRLERSVQEKKQWSEKGEKGPKKTDNEKMARGNSIDWSGKTLGMAVKTAKDKLEHLEKVEKPKEIPAILYTIPMSERSGDIVFELKGVEKMMGKKKIGPIDLKMQFGNKLVILGDNGAGKTTLLKMLVGDMSPDFGEMCKGSRVEIGYLPQESELSDTAILGHVKELSGENESEFRKLLNNLGITKEEMKKGRNELSPGERSRFVLASLIARKPNCLIFDEPTNHLDIYALDFLEDAVKSFEGTVIIVTHDRYFLSKIGEYKAFSM